MNKQNKQAEIELTDSEVENNFSEYELNCKKEQLEKLGLTGGPKRVILDAGCGPGSFGLLLARNGNTVFGVDLSAKAVETARRKARGERIPFWPVIGDLEHLPFKKNYFDLCFCGNILHHFKDVNLIVTEVVRVLKPGGTFACVENNGSNPLVWLSRFGSRHARRFWPLLRKKDSGNIDPHSHREYINVLSRYGITDIRVVSHFYGFAPEKDDVSGNYHTWERVLWKVINKTYGLGVQLMAKLPLEPYRGNMLLIKGSKEIELDK